MIEGIALRGLRLHHGYRVPRVVAEVEVGPLVLHLALAARRGRPPAMLWPEMFDHSAAVTGSDDVLRAVEALVRQAVADHPAAKAHLATKPKWADPRQEAA